MDHFRYLWLEARRWLHRGWPASKFRKSDGYSRPERIALLKTLRYNPGFRLLTFHLERFKAVYERELASHTTAPRSLDEIVAEAVRFARLRGAIYWIGWVQSQVERAEAMPEEEKEK